MQDAREAPWRQFFNDLRRRLKLASLGGNLFAPANIDKRLGAVVLLVLYICVAGCQRQSNAVSGTIEVDEVHVGPRSGGRVEKIFAQEGDKLQAGQPIVQLEAFELNARRQLAAAQIETAIHDADAQAAQLEFLRADAVRQQDLLKRKDGFAK